MTGAVERSGRVLAMGLALCFLPGTDSAGITYNIRPGGVQQSVPPATLLLAAGFGPDAVEDGIVEPASAVAGTAATSAGGAAAALLSTDTAPSAPAPDPLVTLVQQAQGLVPEAEYSLDALAKTLPSDPSALDTFVRDIGIDLYDGVLRGALGVTLSWTLFGIYSTAKDCLSNGFSVTCAVGVVGTLSSGLGGSIGKAGGRVGSTAGVLSNAYSTLTNPQNQIPNPEPPDPNAPNACGLMCTPGDPSPGDGDGSGRRR